MGTVVSVFNERKFWYEAVNLKFVGLLLPILSESNNCPAIFNTS